MIFGCLSEVIVHCIFWKMQHIYGSLILSTRQLFFNLSVHLHGSSGGWVSALKDLAIWFLQIWFYLACLPPSRNRPLHGSTVLFLTYRRSSSWRTLPPSKWKLACWYGNSLTYGECLKGQCVATPGHLVAPDMIEVKKQRAQVIEKYGHSVWQRKRGL